MKRAEQYLIWIALAALTTAAIAWVAFQVQQDGIAPAVLFPLAVGALLGAALVAIARFARLQLSRRTAIVGTVCWGLLAVFAQDYIGHRYRLRQYHAELDRANPLAATIAHEGQMLPTFSDHLSETWHGSPGWWTLDLALTAAAAGAVVAIGPRWNRQTSD